MDTKGKDNNIVNNPPNNGTASAAAQFSPVIEELQPIIGNIKNASLQAEDPTMNGFELKPKEGHVSRKTKPPVAPKPKKKIPKTPSANPTQWTKILVSEEDKEKKIPSNKPFRWARLFGNTTRKIDESFWTTQKFHQNSSATQQTSALDDIPIKRGSTKNIIKRFEAIDPLFPQKRNATPDDMFYKSRQRTVMKNNNVPKILSAHQDDDSSFDDDVFNNAVSDAATIRGDSHYNSGTDNHDEVCANRTWMEVKALDVDDDKVSDKINNYRKSENDSTTAIDTRAVKDNISSVFSKNTMNVNYDIYNKSCDTKAVTDTDLISNEAVNTYISGIISKSVKKAVNTSKIIPKSDFILKNVPKDANISNDMTKGVPKTCNISDTSKNVPNAAIISDNIAEDNVTDNDISPNIAEDPGDNPRKRDMRNDVIDVEAVKQYISGIISDSVIKVTRPEITINTVIDLNDNMATGNAKEFSSSKTNTGQGSAETPDLVKYTFGDACETQTATAPVVPPVGIFRRLLRRLRRRNGNATPPALTGSDVTDNHASTDKDIRTIAVIDMPTNNYDTEAETSKIDPDPRDDDDSVSIASLNPTSTSSLHKFLRGLCCRH